MKNSNSRDKNVKTQIQTPSQPNRLMKTEVQQPRAQNLDRTSYNRPASGKKIDSGKNIPPKPQVAKKQYVVEDNMTESRIHEAKLGLQLLKKKMSSKGLSREKSGTQQKIEEVPSMKKVTSLSSHKSEEANHYENRNNNIPPKKVEKPAQPESYGRRPPQQTSTGVSNKNIGSLNNTKTTPQNQRKQPPPPSYNQYRNEQEEIPIKAKKDFNALLEEELRKEAIQQKGLGNKNNTKPSFVIDNGLSEYPDLNMQLIKCQHCDRMFGQAAIQKHEKICLKVFQQKRKAFDSAAFRAPQTQGFDQAPAKKSEPAKNAKKPPAAQNTKKVQQAYGKKQQEAIPKWKAASLAFRASLKAANGKQMTKQQKQAADVAQGMVVCNYCGRKFNQKAAERHIPFCETKSKQVPKMNTSTRKK